MMETRLMRTGNKVTCIEPGAEVVPPSFVYPYNMVSEDRLGMYWRLMLKRKWVIVATIFVALTIGAISSFRATRLYEAVGRIAILRENPNSLGLKGSEGINTSEDFDDMSVMLDTQVKILQSDMLAREVIKDLHLEANPSFVGHSIAPVEESSDPLAAKPADPGRDDSLLDQLKGSLLVSVVPRTQIVQISYLSPDPRLSAQIVNALAHAYIEQNFKTKYDAMMQTSEWLNSELGGLKTKVESSQEKLVRYQKDHGILGIDEKENIVTSKLDELNKELTKAEADRIEKQSQYEISQSGDADLVATIENGTFDKLRAEQADIRSQIAQAKMQFGPAYPKVLMLEDQLEQNNAALQGEIERIKTLYKNEFLAAQQREKMLRASLEQQKQEANALNESAIEYNLLKRDVETNRQLYEGLLQKMKEAGVSAGLKSSNVRIVDAARIPTYPAKPNIPRTMAMALFLGIVGSLGIVFVMERIDNTVHTPEEAQLISALPSLGIIPRRLHNRNGQQKLLAGNDLISEAEDKVELVTHGRPKSEIAESYRALRTSILLSTTGQPPRVIVVTSALPQEGKTTTSTNSAIVLAQRGARVLLVDADLRRPGIHRLLGIPAVTGLSTLLTGSGTFENTVIASSKIPNLSILPAGPIPPQPAELLGSDVMHNFIQQWREEYDHIVIDTPPVLSVTDAVLLSVKADSVLLVIRAGVTSKPALRRSSDLLQQVNARVVGVVVNGVDTRSPDMQGYYYYGSKYGAYYTEDSSKTAYGS